MQDKGVDGVVVLNCPTAVTSPKDAAQAVAEVVAKRKQPPVLTSWLGDRAALEARQLFAERGIPTYDMPEEAVGAFMQMVAYRRNQEILMQTPASLIEELEPDTPPAQAIIARALAAGRSWLTEVEGKEILTAYGVPVTPTRLAGSPREAAALAAEIDGPVALKIVSPDILHKSDIGGSRRSVDPAHVEGRSRHARALAATTEAQLTGRRAADDPPPGAYGADRRGDTDQQFGPMLFDTAAPRLG
jgi:acetyltransferase